ncbi:MAG: transcription termination factor NusA [Dehalococcoidia bacterium]
MKSDFLVALTQLAAERGLPKDKVMTAIEAALVSAFKKDSVTEGRNISVRLDPGSGDIQVDIIKTVVSEVEDPLQEISLSDAKSKYGDHLNIGDSVATENIPNSAGRIAAQTAKQVVLQRLREAEREIVLSEYNGREGEIITVTIQRIEPTKIIVDTGRAEAILPISQQVPNERYRQGTKIKVILQTIDKDSVRGPELIVSRTDELLLRRLFEQEVPEIFSGSVEIVSVARESGSRSKVAVRARQDSVDPVGSCVGLRGVRIQSIVNELQGEKIDILEWNKDLNKYISNALSPSQVHRVDVNQESNTAVAIVPDRHLSLAIGKEGQNARLAAKLVGFNVDIKSDMEIDISAMPEEVETIIEEGASPEADSENVDTSSIAESPSTVNGNGVTSIDIEESQTTDTPNPEEVVTLETDQVNDDSTEESKDSSDEVLTPEEELLLMELEEEESKDSSDDIGAEISNVPEDIWSVHRAMSNTQESGGMIRFAEDIDDLKGGITARKDRRGSSQTKNTTAKSKSKSKKTKSTKKRR